MRELGLGFRAKYLAAVASAVSKGGFDLFALREADYDEALSGLLALPGVGDKVANCVLLFSLDKLEAFPVDRWVARELQETYGVRAGRDASRLSEGDKKEMRLWGQRHFGCYAGYASQYLFHDRRMRAKRAAAPS